MIREIKFRAWDIEQRTMNRVTSLDWTGSGAYITREDKEKGGLISNSCRVWWGDEPDIILEEFTGLSDKKRTKDFPNGQEIWEGDIVENHDDGRVCEIVYCPHRMRFGFKRASGISYEFRSTDDLEVIGNVHENLELMKKEL